MTLVPGDAGCSARIETNRSSFVGGLMSQTKCVVAANFIIANAADYTAGNLGDAQVARVRVDILTAQSWTSVASYNLTPPSIPSSLSL